jgi:hypothetical protein
MTEMTPCEAVAFALRFSAVATALKSFVPALRSPFKMVM